MVSPTPNIVNEINYRSDEEIDLYFKKTKNSDEDTAMWIARQKVILRQYFHEKKPYKDKSLEAQLSKFIGDIRDHKLSNKLRHYETWLIQQRLFFKNYFMKKYPPSADSVVQLFETKIVEVNVDYKDRHDQLEKEVMRLQMRLQQSREDVEEMKRSAKLT